MARWEPNARERLEAAALELFQEHGYAKTTVQDIAERAGLTERTFFRYYADKREVLFGGSSALEKLITDTVAGAPAKMAPLDVVASAIEAVGEFVESRGERGRQRAALVLAHPELQERELQKLRVLAAAIASALRARGISETVATLAAEAGIAVFRVAFDQWLADKRQRALKKHIASACEELKTLARTATKPRA